MPARQRAKEQTLAFRPTPWLISAGLLAADQASKHAVLLSLQPGESVPILPPVLYFSHVLNTGAAFGLFKGQQLLFIVCSLAVIAWIGRELLQRQPPPRLTAWAYALVLGGALGNLIDRLRFGHVVDFIDVRVWPVFNIGDSAITVGVAILVIQALFSRAGKRS